MSKRKLLWSLVAALPLILGGSWVGWQAMANAAPATVDCCYDPFCPPGCSDECPPDCCPPCSFCP